MTSAPGEHVPVLHVINGEFYAGAERVQELLADRLPEYGYRAGFVCLKQGQFERALAESPHPCHRLTMRSRLDLLRQAAMLARHVRETRSRLIHTHTPRSALVGALASLRSGVPFVHHVHSPTSRDSARAWLNRINTLAERAALLRARALLPVSQSLARDLRQQGYSDRRITVIPNGVAVSEQTAQPWISGVLTLGTVALFRPRKGMEVLIESMARMREQGRAVRLRAVGGFETPEYESRIRGLCRRLAVEDLVEWRGFRRDVAAELSKVDVLVLPSLFGEGMPMVVLEAMAVGLPVVASRVEGVPEVVRDGRDGVLVEPGDPEALAAALGKLADAPSALSAMGASGRNRQRQEFSDFAMAERLSRVYDRLLGLADPGRTDQKLNRISLRNT